MESELRLEFKNALFNNDKTSNYKNTIIYIQHLAKGLCETGH